MVRRLNRNTPGPRSFALIDLALMDILREDQEIHTTWLAA